MKSSQLIPPHNPMYFTTSLMHPKIQEYSPQSKAAAARATAKTLPIVAAALLAEAAPVNGGMPVVEGEEPEPEPVPVAAPDTELTTVVAATVVGATLERVATGMELSVGTTTLEVSTAVLEASVVGTVGAAEDSRVDETSVVVATGTEVVAATEEVAGAAPTVDEKSTQISPLT